WMYMGISYFELNDHIYDNNKKKIISAASFINKGTATSWAETFYEAAGNKG
ncbi:hypothetical protein BS17DRAFT_706847, partial [Gyrodon lividus]